MGRAQTLAVEVVLRAEPIEDDATRRDFALGGNRQHFVDPAAELGVDDHLGQHSAHRAIELEGGSGELLAGDDGDRERVDVQLGGRRRDQRDLHGLLSVKGRT